MVDKFQSWWEDNRKIVEEHSQDINESWLVDFVHDLAKDAYHIANSRQQNIISNKIDSYYVKIFMAGPVQIAEQVCREYCTNIGLCVSITHTKYIYSFGEESGYVVELINYPRFPSNKYELLQKAKKLAEMLLDKTYQGSYTLMTPENSYFVSRREENK